jgi:hypothetical protein
MRDELFFYDPTTVNASALGLTGTAPFLNWATAIRLTPTELGMYHTGNLTGARIFHRFTDVDPLGPYATGHYGNLTIYDEGTASSPGTELARAPWFSNASEWVYVNLTTPVEINGTKDMWVVFTVSSYTGEHPMGLDGGPGVAGKGDWAMLPDGSWLGLVGAGIDRNNCIGAFVEGGTGEVNNVGMESIDLPESGEAQVFTPTVTVENYGTTTPTDVPVSMEIRKVGASVTLLDEEFDEYHPEEDLFPPAGWSIVNTSVYTWFKWYPTSSQRATCDEDPPGTGSASGIAQDEWLYTPVMDLSTYSSVTMSYYRYMYVSGSGGDSMMTVMGSTDGGTSFPNTIATYTSTASSGVEAIDLTSWAAGQSSVQIAFRFQSTADTYTYDYFYFDDFQIFEATAIVSEDFESLWTSAAPPTGWSIEDYGSESPPVWNNNDWYRYYYSGSYKARIYYTPYEMHEDWLITPTIDCSLLSNVVLEFWQYFYYYSGSPGYGYIDGSTDNGSTWTESIAAYSSTQSSGNYVYDISSWAAGESQVKIRFRYNSTTTTYGRYWYVDEVFVGEKNTALFATFDDVIPEYGFPPSGGWFTYDYYGSGENWMGSTSTTYDPPDSTVPYALIRDDSGLPCAAGLFTPVYDFTGVETARLEFNYLYDYDEYYGGGYASVDVYSGPYWYGPLVTYEDANAQGHEVIIFNPQDYAYPNFMYFEFYYYDEGISYAEEFSVDNVELTAIPLTLEYSDTVLVDFTDNREGKAMQVELPTWIPADWQVTTDQTIEYFVTADIALPGDIDPTNDAIGPESVYLWYPFINDMGAISIYSLASGPAQTFPVEVTIENFGQFPANAYQVDVEIGAITDEEGHDQDFESGDGYYTSTGSWAWGTPTTGPGAAHSGSKLWATNLNGNYPTNDNAKLETLPITVPTGADLEFWMWYDTEFSYDGMNVKISNDSGATWTILGAYLAPYDDDAASTANAGIPGEPCFSGHGQGVWTQYSFDLATYEGEEVIIRFHFGSDGSVQYPGMYIDDVKVGTYSATLVGEYAESVILTTQIDPDGTLAVTLPDWTPAALAAGVSGDIKYVITAETSYNPDQNTLNDDTSAQVTLEYWHDIEVDELLHPPDRDVVLAESFEDEWVADSSGDLAPPGGWEVHITNAGGSDPFFYHWMRVGDVPYSSGTVSAPDGDYQCICHWDYYDQDEWLCTPQITLGTDSELTFMFYGHYGSTYGDHYYVKVSPTGGYEKTDFTDTVWDASTEPTGDNHYDFPVVIDLSAYDGETIRIAWNDWAIGGLWYSNIIDQISVESTGGGAPGGDLFMQPGTYDIEALIANTGVFDESDVDLYAELFEFNETGFPILLWDANITDIAMDAGATYNADFGSYAFTVEQVYQLDIEAMIPVDDHPDNNMVTLGLAIDGTAPESEATLDPAGGGWYTEDVTVTITANDGTEDWQSGVADIFYKIDGGTTMTYSDPFVISSDGEHTVTYWAVDNAGNKESDNTIDVDIDTTGPTIDLTWEAGSATNEVIFTATCSDTLSGMDMVEFYINDVLQTTVTTSPYTWTMVHGPGTKYTVKAIAYDMAGNTDFDEIGSGEGTPMVYKTTPLIS